MIDQRGVCPWGWHVPKDEEWTKLVAFLSEKSVGLEMDVCFAAVRIRCAGIKRFRRHNRSVTLTVNRQFECGTHIKNQGFYISVLPYKVKGLTADDDTVHIMDLVLTPFFVQFIRVLSKWPS